MASRPKAQISPASSIVKDRGLRPDQLLMRILEEPALVSAIRSLPARVLGQLIGHLGLEDSGELIALASTDQLVQIMDNDLWQSERPGEDEAFDAERFSLWLEVMLEAGPSGAGERAVRVLGEPLSQFLAFSVRNTSHSAPAG